MSCTTAKNCWWPSCFSCFSSTRMKYLSKQHCIMTQSTAPGRLMSVAKNTMSSPTRVVMVLWAERRWSRTKSKFPPCQVQVVPGHGQEYGRNGHCSSCWRFVTCSIFSRHPEATYLQGNWTLSATFSMARFRTPPRGPRQLGQHWTFCLHGVQMICPESHW